MVEYTLDTTEKEYWEQKSCVQDYDDKGLWDIIEEYGFELNGDSNFSYFNDYAEHNFNEDEFVKFMKKRGFNMIKSNALRAFLEDDNRVYDHRIYDIYD